MSSRKRTPGCLLLLSIATLTPCRLLADPTPALSLHIQPVGFGNECGLSVVGGGRCQAIEVEGTPGQAQRVYVLASDVGSLAGIRFGIAYGPEILVGGWTSCVSGSVIDAGGWPASGSAAALATDIPVPPSGLDDMVLIGFFELESSSAGVFAITPDTRIGAAEYVDADLVTHEFPVAALGRVDVAGTGLGTNPCGLEWTPDPPAPPTDETPGEVPVPPTSSGSVTIEGQVAVVLEPNMLVLSHQLDTDGYFAGREHTRALSEVAYVDSLLLLRCEELGITKVMKVVPRPETASSHTTRAVRERSYRVVPQIKDGDPTWNLQRYIRLHLDAGIDSVEVRDSTLVFYDSHTWNWTDRSMRSYVFYFGDGLSSAAVVESLSITPGIASCRVVYGGRYYGSQDCNSPYDFDIYHNSFESPEMFCDDGGSWVVPAWHVSEGLSNKLVHVFDTQPSVTHPDLIGGLFQDCEVDEFTPSGHGTGTVGAIVGRPNDVGVIGVAPASSAQLFPLRNYGSNESPAWQPQELALLINLNTDCFFSGDIATMALGTTSWDLDLEDAIEGLFDAGVLVLAAQSDEVPDWNAVYPCSWDDHVTCVGASDRQGGILPRNSSTDIFAPADQVWRATIWNGDNTWQRSFDVNRSGSHSTAFAAGVAALVQGANDGVLTGVELSDRLRMHGSASQIHAYNAVSGAIPAAPVTNFVVTPGVEPHTVIVSFTTRISQASMSLDAAATCQGEYRFGGPAGATYDEDPSPLGWRFTLPAPTGELWIQLTLYENQPPYEWGYMVGSAIPNGETTPQTPATPTNLDVEERSSSEAVLTWDECAGATSYAVYRTAFSMTETDCADPHESGNALIYAVVDAGEATSAGTVTFEDDGYHDAGHFSYQVRAFDWGVTWPPRAWESGLSEAVEIGAPVAVPSANVVPLPRFKVAPNPVRYRSALRFEAGDGHAYSATVVDASGRLVRTLLRERTFSSGEQEVVWDGTNGSGRPVPNGVYFVVLDTDGVRSAQRLVIIR